MAAIAQEDRIEDLCEQCQGEASVYCQACGNNYCTTCNLVRHRVGKRRDHTFIVRQLLAMLSTPNPNSWMKTSANITTKVIAVIKCVWLPLKGALRRVTEVNREICILRNARCL